jgi:uncharacterized membrane protein YkoI
MSHHLRSLFFALAACTLCATAQAGNSRENDAIATAQAKIPLTKAIEIAEAQAGGKAVRAEYEESSAGWVCDVEVVGSKKVFDIKVDAKNGKVVASSEDEVDHDDDQDRVD